MSPFIARRRMGGPLRVVIPPAAFPTVLTPILGTFAATGKAATGAADGINLVSNGENWTGGPPPTGWTEANNTSLAVNSAVDPGATSGGVNATAIKIANTGASPSLYQIFTAIIGARYVATCRAYAPSANTTVNAARLAGFGGISFGADIAVEDAWAAIATAVDTATGTSPRVYVACRAGAASTIGDVAYFDSVSCQQHRSLSRFTLAPHGRVDLPITMPAASSVVPIGILARLAWPSGWYLRITPNTAGTDFEIVEINAGVMTTRASSDQDWTAETTYTIGLGCAGNVITAYVNGVATLSYTDTSNLWLTVPHWGIMDSAWPGATFGTIVGRAG